MTNVHLFHPLNTAHTEGTFGHTELKHYPLAGCLYLPPLCLPSYSSALISASAPLKISFNFSLYATFISQSIFTN